MRNAEKVLGIHQARGQKDKPIERVYRHLFNPEFYLAAYAKIGKNEGALTQGVTDETVDGMSLAGINRIIELLQNEKYVWKPVRRKNIPKKDGKKRPLGIPTWGDKLLQEVMRSLLEAYYEPKFSAFSHGFRLKRGCHTALSQVQKTWTQTVWFIEGDITKCFDTINHDTLINILEKDIHDGRFIRLIRGLLEAGYMEDGQWHKTPSGTPQGGVISPLLANIYLSKLDDFVETALVPDYTRGETRKLNREYKRIQGQVQYWAQKGDAAKVKDLKQRRRSLPSHDRLDPDYRRLRYVRYADDFLLGFIGPKTEAEAIKRRISTFLGQHLNLTLSDAKTLITHADTTASFLGYEVTRTKFTNRINRSGQGAICLLVPQQVEANVKKRFCKNGKPVHFGGWTAYSDFEIVNRYQAVLRGLYNYYAMGVNVSRRMGNIKWVLEQSLVKTLANKHKTSYAKIYQRLATTNKDGYAVLKVRVERDGKKPLAAEFGGFGLVRTKTISISSPFDYRTVLRIRDRSSLIDRLLKDRCELCGSKDRVQVHHVRRIREKGKRLPHQEIKAVINRKAVVVCHECHWTIHRGKYDGPRLG